MHTIRSVILAGVVASLASINVHAQQLVHFPLHKFSIAPIETSTEGRTALIMSMALPPTDGFAANINILAQPSNGSIDDYAALTRRQLAAVGYTIHKFERSDDHTLIIEYSGSLTGRALHWYAKASLSGSEVLLATATATPSQWESYSTQLEACINSFQRDAR